jgi:hypothetical protein
VIHWNGEQNATVDLLSIPRSGVWDLAAVRSGSLGSSNFKLSAPARPVAFRAQARTRRSVQRPGVRAGPALPSPGTE